MVTWEPFSLQGAVVSPLLRSLHTAIRVAGHFCKNDKNNPLITPKRLGLHASKQFMRIQYPEGRENQHWIDGSRGCLCSSLFFFPIQPTLSTTSHPSTKAPGDHLSLFRIPSTTLPFWVSSTAYGNARIRSRCVPRGDHGPSGVLSCSTFEQLQNKRFGLSFGVTWRARYIKTAVA